MVFDLFISVHLSKIKFVIRELQRNERIMLMGERGFYRQSRVALRAAILISAYCAAVECIFGADTGLSKGVES